MIRVPLVCVADARTQGMVAELPCMCGGRLLRAERSRYMLAAGKLQHIVLDWCTFRPALGTGLNEYIRHISSCVVRVR